MKDTIGKLKEINAVIKDFDPTIKERAANILFNIAFPEGIENAEESPKSKQQKSGAKDTKPNAPATSDPSVFFAKFENGAPKDNVNLISAWLYSQFGVYSISSKDMKEVASSVGLVIPTRPDNTMRQAKKNGKALYRQNGKGWEPTVSGELFFKEQYSVGKGNKERLKD
jgi:hypothetical protein